LSVIRETSSPSSSASCVPGALNHYLFCGAWNDTALSSSRASCQDPTLRATLLAQNAISQLQIFGPLFQNDINALQNIIKTLKDISSCEDSSQVYTNAKKSLCWDVSNALLTVVLLILLLLPVLSFFLVYLYHSWYRFVLVNTPQDAFYSDGFPKRMIHKAFEILDHPQDDQVVLLKNKIEEEEEESDAGENMRFLKADENSNLRRQAAEIVEISQNACHKYMCTVLWSLIMLMVLAAAVGSFILGMEKFSTEAARAC